MRRPFLTDTVKILLFTLGLIALTALAAGIAAWLMTPPAGASWLQTQTWHWSKRTEPDVASYRLYWGASGTAWCKANNVEFSAATSCGLVNHCASDAECCGEIPMPTFSPAFIVVTAVDTSGNESITEHGSIVECP